GATTLLLSTPDLVVFNCGAATLTGTEPVQRAAAGQVGSPPPLAVAVLSPVVADAATATFSVSCVFALATNVPLNVQLSVLVPVQLQFVPLALVSVIPAGNVSAMVIAPAVVALPVLLTVIE